MKHRSEPSIAIYSAAVNATADMVRQHATDDGVPGHVRRVPPGTTYTLGNDEENTTLIDGDEWHIWQVGL